LNVGYSQDTIRNEDGTFEVGNMNKNKELVGWWKEYDSTGRLISEGNKTTPKVIDYIYNNRGVLIAYGKRAHYSGRYGKWKIFDDNGILIRIEHYQYDELHGITHFIKEKRSVKYYYGLTKDKLRNSKGKKIVFYFKTGMPPLTLHEIDYSCREDKFACKTLRLAGCVSTREIQTRKDFHNFFADIKQKMRYGSNWKNQYFEEDCK
jgi:hypothetical protein